MFLTEWDQAKALEQERRETIRNEQKRVARDMLMEKLPLSLIAKISQLSEDAIRKLAKTLGITVS